MKSENQHEWMSDVHLTDDWDGDEAPVAMAEDMLCCDSRPCISLNGPWHYCVDQYDTCIRQKWYEERYFDEQGLSLPVDFSFDEWPVMELPCCWNLFEKEYFLYEGTMVFTRKFSCKVSDGERVILRIGAAAYSASWSKPQIFTASCSLVMI